MRKLRRIIVHCSATPPDWLREGGTAYQVSIIRKWHVQDRGWRDIGYHYVVGREGFTVLGRPIDQAGAHVRGHNADSVGVCLIGGHGASADDEFLDHFTPDQDEELQRCIAMLRAEYGPLSLWGHNDFANKGCPGFRVFRWAAARNIPTYRSASHD